MGFSAFPAIGIGAASGAWLRWGLGMVLDPAETVTLLLRQQYLWTLTIILSHVLGSIGMTLAGVVTIQ